VLAPQTVQLRWTQAYRLTAVCGSVLLTGRTATLRTTVSYRLTAAGGALLLTGRSVNLLYTPGGAGGVDIVLQAGAGLIALTGRSADMYVGSSVPPTGWPYPEIVRMGRKVILTRW